MQHGVRAMLVVGLGLLTAQGYAEDAATQSAVESNTGTTVSADDAFDFFLQEAQVVTASRRAQKKSDSPVAIDVITREEIESSGARNIYDLLRFRVGVDVVEGNSIEGNPALVNVRGLPEEFSQALQVLIDGRSVVNMQSSGIYWRRLPVAMDDIERIEIVRGPNSALFGANAGQGVINIITFKPGSGKGSYRAEVGTLGQRKAHFALDSGGESFAVRGSFDNGAKSSNFTALGEQPTSGNKTDDDTKLYLRGVGRLWSGADLDISMGRTAIKYSYPVALGIGGDTLTVTDYQNAKLTQALNEALNFEFTTSRRFENSASSLGGSKETVYDGDMLMRASLADGKSQTVLGISGRYGEVYAPGLFSNTLAGTTLYKYTRSDAEVTRYQHQRRAYVSEQAALADWLSVALAASYEGSDTGGEQPAYQGAVILKPMEDSSLRLSGSKSPTMPSLLNKFARLELITGSTKPYSVPFAAVPRLSAVRVEGSDITPPQVASYEATLATSVMERRLSFELTGFQMEISGYPEFVDGGSFAFNPPTNIPGKAGQLVRYANLTDIVARGTETTIVYKPRVGTVLQLNHTYEHVETNKPTTRYDNTTPWNKVNFIASTTLPLGFNVGGALGWKGEHIVTLPSKSLSLFVPDQAKLDLRVGYKPFKDVELYAVGANLDHMYRTESPDGLAATQSYAGGINVAWGGSSK